MSSDEYRFMSRTHASATIVRFPGSRQAAAAGFDQKALLDAVYTSGSIPIRAEDLETKQMAARLHLFGFFLVDEIQSDGTVRRLLPSETARTGLSRPWQVSRPGFSAALDEEEDEPVSLRPGSVVRLRSPA